MIGIEQYRKIQEYKALGLAQTKTAKALGITYSSVSKYWNMSEEDYVREAEKERYHMDNYRQYILEHLKICPQMRDTNIYLKLVEAFPDLQVKRATFYRYMKALREQHGYPHASKRKTSPREISPPGYEAQADFGQYKLKDMYGRIVRIYFFCMVLSYSRMKFVYFSPDPFTTKTAIKAHNYAFQYFGGRTQTILYDLDRVYVVSENLGNIIFVPTFEEYVRRIGYSVSLCRPRDPQSKGKVEEVIGYIKQSFLEGRIYTGIDCLNSAALAWLDREGNGRIHTVTRKVPREMFMEEQKYLNLWNIAKGYIDLNDEKLSNLDYLKMVLEKELEIRARQKHTKLRKASKLPNKAFDASNLNKGLKWQIKQLSNLTWLKEEQNLILLGKCGTGKSGLAAQLGETAISNGHKTYYAPFDNFIAVAEKKATNPKAEAIFSYMQECDLIIIDDVFYVEPTRAELQVFYRAVTFLNETRSIIFITNRELSAWIDAAEDKHLCQTLLDRMTVNCQIVRLTDK